RIDDPFGSGVTFHTGRWHVHLIAHELGMMIASSLPVFTPPDRISAMLDLVNRLNNMSLSGLLEVAPDTGQIRLRHCISAPPQFISSRLIRESLRHNLTMCRHAIPRLADFIKREMSAETAAANWLHEPIAVKATPTGMG